MQVRWSRLGLPEGQELNWLEKLLNIPVLLFMFAGTIIYALAFLMGPWMLAWVASSDPDCRKSIDDLNKREAKARAERDREWQAQPEKRDTEEAARREWPSKPVR